MPESNGGDAARQAASELETVAAGADLGEPVATYRWRGPSIPWRGYVILGTITVLVCGAWVYLIGFDAAVLSGPLLLLVLGLPLWLRRRSRSIDPNARLTLYSHGLVARGADGAVRVARYDTTLAYVHALVYPANFVRRGPGPIGYRCALTDIAGQRFSLDADVESEFWQRGGYRDPQLWAPAIQDGILKACFGSAAAALVTGQTLTFGPVHLSALGIATDGPPLAWPDIEEVRAQAGRLGVTVDEAWRPLNGAALELIPNFRLLHALTDHLRRPAEPDSQPADEPGEPHTD
ncbi:DUF6585 family protein [Nocardia sp. NPDC057030]|uniref:DUF6585 family protein n=1 Tax=unclassified Nocardia TaxID=2637762 RepID=UPI00363BC10A